MAGVFSMASQSGGGGSGTRVKFLQNCGRNIRKLGEEARANVYSPDLATWHNLVVWLTAGLVGFT